MKKTDHLPVFGVGPVCVYTMIAAAAAGLLLLHFGFITSGSTDFLRLPLKIAGLLLIAAGIFMWVKAVIGSKISREIKKNHLVTDGIYAWVRNPIYSAVAIALTGLCLMSANLWLILLLPVFFWLDITVIMKLTEEKWLLELYGEEYADYCRKVNRCIPWFPKR